MRIPRYHEQAQAYRPTDPGRQASSGYRRRSRSRSVAVAALTSVVLAGGAAPAQAEPTEPPWAEASGGSLTSVVPDVDALQQGWRTGPLWPGEAEESGQSEQPDRPGKTEQPAKPAGSEKPEKPAAQDVDGPRQGWQGEPPWSGEAEGSGTSAEPEKPAEQDETEPEPEQQDGLPSSTIEKAISAAESKKGKPYRWGGTGPNAFDCSGLVQWSFKQAGVSLPRVTHDQVKAGTKIPYSQARRGDLLYWSRNGAPAHHVAIYLGDGRMIDAPRRGDHVRERAVTRQNLAGAVRL